MRLCELPRNLRKFARVELPEPVPVRFTLDEIKTLWDAACPRVRCFIALGLNCGFGQQDIADLRASEINWEKGVLDRKRSKTGIRATYKLWPVTLTLLKQEMEPDAQGDDLVFQTANGSPLIQTGWADGKLSRSDTIKCAFWRVQQKTGINGHRGFYALRKTGASEIELIDSTATEMYLAHSEKGQKKNYAERNWGALGAALDQLNTIFNLKTEQP